MAQEEQKLPENHHPDLYEPTEGWPAGMFPSPIRNEHFDPYENPDAKLAYHQLGGSQDEILQYATEQAVARQPADATNPEFRANMVEQAASMIDEKQRRSRVAEYIQELKKKEP